MILEQSLPAKPKILIVLIAGIGDVVLASPGIRALRNGHPDAEIHLLTSAEAAPLAVSCPYIDHVYSFPIRQMRKSKKFLFEMIEIAMVLRKIPFTAIVNLYQVCSFAGAAKMGLLFCLLRGESKFGHDRYGFGMFLDQGVAADAFTGRHVVEAMVDIAALAGGMPDQRGTEVFWNEETKAKWKDFFSETTGEIVVGINPGGDRENRRWRPDRFAGVAVQMVERYNARIVLLGGPTERHIAADIAGRIKYDVSDLSGKIQIEELPYVISRFDLLITNDSGPMHIAAATKTPLVVLFGPEDPTLFGPYTKPELCRVIYKGGPGLIGRKKNKAGISLLDRITPEDVFAASIELLGLRK